MIVVTDHPNEEKVRKMNMFSSLIVSISNAFQFKNHLIKEYNSKKLKMNDGAVFQIFKHMVIGNKKCGVKEKGAIFVVRFKLSGMSIEKNERFSWLPIPFFTGLPGFRAKFWMSDKTTGYNQGIYQWKTQQDAINYSKSFAVRFMTARSIPGSVSFNIIPDENIYDYTEKYLIK